MDEIEIPIVHTSVELHLYPDTASIIELRSTCSEERGTYNPRMTRKT